MWWNFLGGNIWPFEAIASRSLILWPPSESTEFPGVLSLENIQGVPTFSFFQQTKESIRMRSPGGGCGHLPHPLVNQSKSTIYFIYWVSCHIILRGKKKLGEGWGEVRARAYVGLEGSCFSWHGLGEHLLGWDLWSDYWRRQGSHTATLGKSIAGRRDSTCKDPKARESLAVSM